MTIKIIHDWYGCDTGCCGSRFVDDENNWYEFYFEHPNSNVEPLEFARYLLEKSRNKKEQELLADCEKYGVEYEDNPETWC